VNTQATFRLRLFALAMGSSLLFACGGGGGGGSEVDDDDPLPTNQGPVADAGAPAQEVGAGFNVNLDGSASSDPDGDSLSYTWRQTYGPNVIGSSDNLSGATPSFTAPAEVCTIIFELEVSDGADSDIDSVQINVSEDVTATLFVDGDNGSDIVDTGDGSRGKPFATIARALDAIDASPRDIYVKSRVEPGVYDETAAPLDVPNGTSLYGGYDADWVRDVTGNRTLLNGHSTAVMLQAVDQPAWVSGFEIHAADSAAPGESVYGVSVQGGIAALYIEDNTIVAGDVAPGQAVNPGSSYGIFLYQLAAVELSRNTITAGMAGHGAVAVDGIRGDPGADGIAATSNIGAVNGTGVAGAGGIGGDGGAGGTAGPPAGSGTKGETGAGPTGGEGGDEGAAGNPGEAGMAGDPGGFGSDGAASSGGDGFGAAGAGFLHSHGVSGAEATDGSGGGGGGGGGGLEVIFNWRFGVGGSGGAQGGGGGVGGDGGNGGGASIGLWLEQVAIILVQENTITSGTGGDGNSGGRGGGGGDGGTGGPAVEATVEATDHPRGPGGAGGPGGNGGNGGIGGAGGGGPSYGILVGPDMLPEITRNTITSGRGGDGGVGASGDFDDNGVYDRRDSAGGNGGQGGASYAIYDIGAAMVPALEDNDLTAGSGGVLGAGGSAGFNAAGAGLAPGIDGIDGLDSNTNF